MGPVSTAGAHLSDGLILVVEDDPLILEFLCEILQEEGFAVEPQVSADAASQYLEQHAPEVGLLLTDITMPGKLNGADLANQFGDRWPDKPIMIMSGFETPKKLRGQASGCVHQETLGGGTAARLCAKTPCIRTGACRSCRRLRSFDLALKKRRSKDRSLRQLLQG